MPLFQSIGETLGLLPASPPKIARAPSAGSIESLNASLAARLEAQRMSPNTRTQEWLANSSPEKKIVRFKSRTSPDVAGVKGGRVVKHASRSSSKSRNKYSVLNYEKSSSSHPEPSSESRRKSGIWDILTGIRFKPENPKPVKTDESTREDDDESVMEGSTLVDGVFDTIEDDEYSDLDGPSNFEGTTLLQDKNGDLKIQDEDGNLHDEDEVDDSDFTAEEHFLIHKLNARGYEPLLHVGWAMDFDRLPGNLFTFDRSRAYISAIKAPEYHAQKALYNLIGIGSRARDALVTGTAPEKCIRRHLFEYYNWSMHDAALKKVNHIPILTITVAHPNEPVSSVMNRCTDRLHALGRRYQEEWMIGEEYITGADGLGLTVPRYKRRLPTILGMVVKSTAVAFLTYDASVPGKEPRNMGLWNLATRGQDAWHAFAIAIFMIFARNYLLQLQSEGLLGREVEEDGNDPDA